MRALSGIWLVACLSVTAEVSAQTIIVTNTNDSGPGSLRQAILTANAQGGADTIAFDIPGPGPFVISPATTLPSFDDGGGVTIDGTTQPGYATQPLIGTGGTVGVNASPFAQLRAPIVQVYGNGIAGNGFTFSGSNSSTLRGLHVWGFTGVNVAFDGSNNAVLESCLIGGTTTFADPGSGLRAATNVLLDRGENPVVRGNLIGFAATDNNVLGAGQNAGFQFEDNELVGSLRIVALASTVAVASTKRLTGNNLIRNSAGYGIDIVGGLDDMTFVGNTIRDNGAGGTFTAGIRFTNTASNTTRNNVVGSNIITGNAGAGILITGDAASSNRGNLLAHNSVFANGGIGIDLGSEVSDQLIGDGPTLNDDGDTDRGGNELFNFAVIESATMSGAQLTVTGWAGARATVEFFVNPGNAREGRTFVAARDEGSADDLDGTTGKYGPAPVNGVSQGTETTNRFTFVIPVPPGVTAGSYLTATATVPSGTRNTSEFSGAVAIQSQGADVAVSKAGPPNVSPGETIAYTITVANGGTAAASAVVVSDPTPAGLVFTSNTGACTTPFPCALGTIPAGQLRSITATFAIPSGYSGSTTIVNTATVSTTSADANPANNSASATTVVSPLADVAVTKTGPSTVTPGTILAYAIVITNSGPSDAAGVVVNDPVPPGLTFVDNSGDCTTAFPCALGTIPAGQVRRIVTRLAVPPGYSAPSPIVNSATAVSTTPDPFLANNTSVTTTTVAAPRADVGIGKGTSRRAARGVTLTYTLVVTNAGPSDAVGVIVSDPTPPGLTFVGNTGDCVTAFPCSFAAIPPGGIRRIVTTLNVPAGYAGPDPIVNTATVTSTSIDPNSENNTATTTTPVGSLGATNVDIAKSGPAAIRPGSSLTYIMVVSNTGTFDVTGVVLDDPTPAGLTFVANAGACTAPFPCALGTVPAGTTRVIETTYAVPAGYAQGPVVNTATLTSTPPDDDPSDNTATTSTLVLPAQADLEITKAGPETIVPGRPAQFSLIVTNKGPADASAVVVDDPLPPGLTVDSVSGCPAPSFPCALGTIPAGQSRTIALALLVPSGYTVPSPMLNTATVASMTVDPDPANNVATTSSTVVAVANLDILKTGPLTVVPGGSLFYTVVVSNTGPSDAVDVIVDDPTPPGLAFGFNEGDCLTAFPCRLGALPAGQQRTIRSRFSVPPEYVSPNLIVNAAMVSSPTAGLDRVANISSWITAVIAVADVALAKTVDAPTAAVGQIVTFTVTARNDGPSIATGVKVVDRLPAGLSLVAAAPSQGTYDGATGVWDIGTIPIGGSAALQLQSRVEAPGLLVNRAGKIAMDQADPDTSNDTAGTVVNAPTPSADVQVLVAGAPSSVAVGGRSMITVTVRNVGPSDATSVLVHVRLAASLMPVEGLTATGTFQVETLNWQIPVLAIGQEATLSIPVVVLAIGPNLAVALKLAQTEPDPVPTNDISGVALNGLAADLQIVKTVDRNQVAIGESLRFTIHVTNNGPDDATGVLVRDLLSPKLAFVSATASQGDYDPATGLWTIGSLPASGPDRLATLEVEAVVISTGLIANTATIAGLDQADPGEGNTDSTVSLASSSLDLAAGLSLIGAPGDVGSILRVFPEVSNVSQAASTGRITFMLTWPQELEHYASPDGWDCSPARLTLVCARDDLSLGPAGRIGPQVYLRVVGLLAAPAFLHTAVANQADVNPANNVASLRVDATLVIDPADLALSQSVTPRTGAVEQVFDVSVTLVNRGPDPAHQAVVMHAVPAGLTLLSATTTAGTCADGAVVTCSLGTIEAGGQREIALRLRADRPGVFSVISSATAIEQDPSLADNQVQTQLIVSGTAQSSSAAPFGAVDLPGEGAVVSGSIAVGGWALDDGGVRHVRIYRDSVAPEPPGLVYIGEAVRVRGARPDVERLFAGVPEADSAGWGLLVLTNLLPNRGTGTYRLHAYAEDDRGQQKLLGSRTIVGVNATATTPFGAIDTPGQGETIHGTAYPIFGWALTPPPAVIAADGSTISVYIDGQAVGGVTYNNYRADVAALFPEYLNAAGAVGYRLLDTTTLGAGLHTVAWSVTDSTGATVGLGSRFFRVQQAAAAVPATARVAAVGERARDVPRQVIAGEMERIEIDATALMPGACTVARYEGQERVGPASRPLPIGSRLDAASGIFTWQPGPGFVGRYRLVFVRQGCDAIPVETPVDVIVRKRDVR